LNKPNNIFIRDFEEKDYPGIAEVFSTVYPDKPTTADEYIEQDKNRNKKCKHRRWVAIADDKIVGTGTYTQNIYQYHPFKFKIWIVVKPEYQNNKIGARLYNQIIESMKQFDPISVITETRNDMMYKWNRDKNYSGIGKRSESRQ